MRPSFIPLILPWRKPHSYVCFTIQNLFSPQECQELIDQSESVGYVPALVNLGRGVHRRMDDVRNSHRLIIDDAPLANEILQRIISTKVEPHEKPWFDKFLTFREKLELIDLNGRLRYLRYGPGQYFKPHCDGSYTTTECRGSRSYVTAQLYLSSVSSGGATRIYNELNKSEYVDVHPQPGMVFLFQHNLLHEGRPVDAGLKYVIRTDVMYQKTNAVD